MEARGTAGLLGCPILAAALLGYLNAAAYSNSLYSSSENGLVFSKRISKIQIAHSKFFEALLHIGQAGNVCIGVEFSDRSAAVADVRPINEENTTVGHVLGELLKDSKTFGVREEQGCAVVKPVGDGVGYLRTRIPVFRVPRISIDMASYYLSQALLATELQSGHKAPSGVVATIASSTDAPQVGPLAIKGLSIEVILCKLTKEIGAAMWIALPQRRRDDWRGYTEPWRFMRYSPQPSETGIRLMLEELPQ